MKQATRWYRDPLLTVANTPHALAGTLIASWFLAGLLFSVLESVSLGDGLYWSIVTMTTTGYGDISPATAPGKVLAGLFMCWSIFFLLPAAIYHVAERLIPDVDEFNDEDGEQVKNDLAAIRKHLGCEGQT